MVGQADAVCSITPPQFTLSELQSLSENTLSDLDVYAARIAAFCSR